MFIRCLHADFVKMKSIPIVIVHIVIPVIISVLFLLYYSFSNWDVNTKIEAFYQAVGIGFPVLIGIFTASIMEQEQNAGKFQNMLTLPQKRIVFISKLSVLLLLSLFAVIFTAVIFGIGCYGILGIDAVSIRNHLMTAFIMWCSSIPLYIWQMILAFKFGKGVSVGAGIVSGLIDALLLTTLGNYAWKYIVFSWTGRIPYTYLRVISGTPEAGNELGSAIVIYSVFTIISMLYYLQWASRYEGGKILE